MKLWDTKKRLAAEAAQATWQIIEAAEKIVKARRAWEQSQPKKSGKGVSHGE